jgi:membrane-associated phospholipid phosphatase
MDRRENVAGTDTVAMPGLNSVNDRPSSAGSRRSIRVVLVGWGILAVLFGIYDLDISRTFASPDSGWGAFVEAFGEIPGLIVIIAALCLLNVSILRDRPRFFIPLAVLSTLLIAMALAYGAGVMTYRLAGTYYFLTDNSVFVWMVAVLVAVLVQVVVLWRTDAIPDHWIEFAQMTFGLAFLNFVLFVQATKPLWGRVRFRDLDTLFSEYTPWFIPQGVTGHMSFPSGHTALGWMLLPLLLLTSGRSRPVRIVAGMVVVGWGLLVAVGRVRSGAHYPSDALFPTGLALVLYLTAAGRMEGGGGEGGGGEGGGGEGDSGEGDSGEASRGEASRGKASRGDVSGGEGGV